MLQKDPTVWANFSIADPAGSGGARQLRPDELLQLTRLAQSLFSKRERTPQVLMFTGVSHGVGTSHIVQMLSEIAMDLGYTAGSVDLSEAFAPKKPIGRADAGFPRRSEAGQATALKSLLDRNAADGRFDVLLLDSPPIARSALPVRLGPIVDGVVLVVETARSKARDIREALDMIEACGGRCCGIVMNHPRRPIFGRR